MGQKQTTRTRQRERTQHHRAVRLKMIEIVKLCCPCVITIFLNKKRVVVMGGSPALTPILCEMFLKFPKHNVYRSFLVFSLFLKDECFLICVLNINVKFSNFFVF